MHLWAGSETPTHSLGSTVNIPRLARGGDSRGGYEIANVKKDQKPRLKTGPIPQRLKLRGDWQALVGKALAKKRPKKGWPKA